MPTEIGFQTKAEIALDLVDQANAWEVPHARVVADADYGDNPASLNGLETRGERMVAGVGASCTVATARRASVAWQRVDDLLDSVPRWQWQTIRWPAASRCWLRAEFVAIRCSFVDGDGTRHMGWLIG